MKHFFTSPFLPYFLLAIIIPFTVNAGSVYKWTDENGVVHYGDKKPANTETKELRVKVGRGTPATSTSKKEEENPSQNETNSEEKAALSPEEKKMLDTACKAAKENLTTMKTYSRIRVKGDDGEFRFLTPEEKTAKEMEATKFVEEKCK